jgi:hypothetical protein
VEPVAYGPATARPPEVTVKPVYPLALTVEERRQRARTHPEKNVASEAPK